MTGGIASPCSLPCAERGLRPLHLPKMRGDGLKDTACKTRERAHGQSCKALSFWASAPQGSCSRRGAGGGVSAVSKPEAALGKETLL